MKFSRRGFVKFSAGSALGLGLSGLSVKALTDVTARLSPDIYPPKGPETFVNSLCQLCPGGCGITVRKIGGRAVRIAGNRHSPVNGSGMCPVGLSALEFLYHPDRVKTPLKRTTGGWESIPWTRALSEIAQRLQDLASGGQGARIVALSHPLAGTLRTSTEALLGALGSKNLVFLGSPSDGNEVGARLQQGVRSRLAYDFANTGLVLSLGCNFLEGWSSPVWTMKGFSEFRGKRPRGRFVYAGSRRSVTASKADTVLDLAPHSEAAFAMGVAYVLISERLYDFEFVHAHCEGFEDWRDASGTLHAGFRTRVLNDYPLNRVSELTGVAPEQVVRVAREFGSTRPAVALAPEIEDSHPNSLMGALCAHSLNALTGSLDRKGGILVQYSDPLDGDSAPETAPLLEPFRHRLLAGEDPIRLVTESMGSGKPYSPSALLLLEVDPLFDAAEPDKARALLRQAPLVVSVASCMNASSGMADYVLPASTFLESEIEESAPAGFPYRYRGLAPAAVERIGESRPLGDIIEALGKELKAEIPPYGERLRERAAHLYTLKRGSIAGTVFDQLWQQLMEQSGWWAPTYESPEQLVSQMQEKGGWWDSSYQYEDWSRSLPAGKFRFFMPDLEPLRTAACVRGEGFYFPHFEALPASGSMAEYPFAVTFFDPLTTRSRHPVLPILRELGGVHAQNAAALWVEVAPVDAERLALRSGGQAWVDSARGRVRALVRIQTSQRPGRISMPLGIPSLDQPGWSESASTASVLSGQTGPAEVQVRISPA